MVNETAVQYFVPGRTCDGCTLCCKVLSIQEIEKPQGKWCDHCSIGSGCRIYDNRPGECRSFNCGFLQLPYIDDRWHPSHCKFVIAAELDGMRMAIHVDPGRPSAWRDEPYYAQIKDWATRAAPFMGQVVVCIGRRVIVVLPHGDKDLGIISDDERIVTMEVATPFGNRLEALKLKADDPRLAAVEAGKVFQVGR